MTFDSFFEDLCSCERKDDLINRNILSKRLTLDGHTVVGTTNGQESVDTIEKDRDFDCILMDIQYVFLLPSPLSNAPNSPYRMPILNGFDASKAIRFLEHTFPPGTRRSTQLHGRIPIFAVSASLQERQRHEMVGYGMDGWILKPIDFRRLRTILDVIMNPERRDKVEYRPGCNWEAGGWFERSETQAAKREVAVAS